MYLQWNCKTATGHICKKKYISKSCNLQLSNEPKNTKNGPKSVEKLNY